MSKITTSYITKNPTYSNPTKIKVQGLLLHSVGCPQENPWNWRNRWDKTTANTSVHGIIGADETIIMLPCMEKTGESIKCWGCGKGSKGSCNQSHLQFEMTESNYIKYIGGATFIKTNKEKAIEFTKKTTENAVELFAQLCKFHNLDPMKEGVIYTHKTAHEAGYASNHGDPVHLWNQLGMNYTVENFKKDINNRLNELIDKEVEDMLTDEQFASYMDRYLANLRTKEGDAWAKSYLDWAKEKGIMVGDEKGNQYPKMFITRQEVATMFKRYYDKLDK